MAKIIKQMSCMNKFCYQNHCCKSIFGFSVTKVQFLFPFFD